MPTLILKKESYTLHNGLVLPEAFLCPLGLFVDQGHTMGVRHVWGVYASADNLNARKNLLEIKELVWSGAAADLAALFPQLYNPIVAAMQAVGASVKDIVVDPEDLSKNVSWFDGTTVFQAAS